MHSVVFLAIIGMVLALPSRVAAGVPGCTTPSGCVKCKETPPTDSCITVKIDAHCVCTLTIPNPTIVCISQGFCDYTGSPPCPNPTRDGECPATPFAPTTPDEGAVTDTDTDTDAAGDTTGETAS